MGSDSLAYGAECTVRRGAVEAAKRQRNASGLFITEAQKRKFQGGN